MTRISADFISRKNGKPLSDSEFLNVSCFANDMSEIFFGTLH